MTTYRYVTLEYENRRVTSATTTEHRAIIDEQAAKGLRYAGYVPTKMGPSGKILAVDLIFED